MSGGQFGGGQFGGGGGGGTPPSPPGLSLVSVASGSVTIAYVAAAGQDASEIDYYVGATLTTIDTTAGSGDYTASGLTNGTLYTFTARAATSGAYSGPSAPVTATPNAASAPGTARELSITYAGVTIGGTSPYYLLDSQRECWKLTGDNFQSRITAELTVVTPAGTEAEFTTKCKALEAAFRTLNGTINVTQGSVTWLSLGASDNEGFLARPRISVVESPKTTGRSKMYAIEVSVNRRANFYDGNTDGRAGLQSAEVAFAVAATGQRALAISGTYTAQSAAAADATYLAQINTYIATITGGFAATTWERSVHNYRYDDQNKIVRFQASARQLLFRQALSSLDHPAIKNDTLTIEIGRVAPGDYDAATSRPVEVNVAYDADLVFSTDPAVGTTNPKAFFDTTILPFLLAQVQIASGASILALTKSAPRPDYPRNRISATLVLMAISGSSILSHSRRTRYVTNYGKIIVPVFDGNKWAKEVFDGPGRRIRTTTEDYLSLGGGQGGSGGGGGGGGGGGSDQFGIYGIGGASDLGQAVGADNFGAFGIGGAQSIQITDGGSGGGGGSGDAPIEAGVSSSYVGGGAHWIKIADDITTDPKIMGLTEANFPAIYTSVITTEEYVEAPSAGSSPEYTGNGGSTGSVGDTSERSASTSDGGGAPPGDGATVFGGPGGDTTGPGGGGNYNRGAGDTFGQSLEGG